MVATSLMSLACQSAGIVSHRPFCPFGSAFAGTDLTAKAISADATRDTDEIHDYITAMTTVDPIA